MSITKLIDSTASSSSSFDAPSVHIDLPSDVVGLFFSFLNQIQDRINLGLTSKDFRAVYLHVSPRALAFHQLFPMLEKPAKELIAITLQRELTPGEQEYDECKITVWEEAGTEGEEELESLPTEAAQVQTLIYESEKALLVFFNIFEEGLKSLKISPLDKSFKHCEWIPQRMILGLANQTSDEVIFHIKVRTVDKELGDSLFMFMVENYSNQPIDEITEKSFNNYCKLLEGKLYLPFGINELHFIRSTLIEAIKDKHSFEEINRVKNEFTNRDVNNPRFIKMKEAVFAERYAEKTRLQAELDELRGTNGFNGTIDKAWQEYQQAITELLAIFSQPSVSQDAPWKLLAFLTDDIQIPAVRRAMEIKRNVEEKNNAYDALVERFNYLAEYAPGTDVRIGGRIYDIETKELMPEFLGMLARDRMVSAILFYQNLNDPLVEEV